MAWYQFSKVNKIWEITLPTGVTLININILVGHVFRHIQLIYLVAVCIGLPIGIHMRYNAHDIYLNAEKFNKKLI